MLMIKKYCKCGCGEIVQNRVLYRKGHNRTLPIESSQIGKLYITAELSMNEIAARLGIAQTTVRRRLRKLELEPRSGREAGLLAARKGKYYMQSEVGRKAHSKAQRGHQSNLQLKYNRDYFKHFSRNMAYILGYIASDGCVSDKNVLFCSKDRELLEKINHELKSEVTVKNKAGYYALSYTSKRMINDLKKLGITQRKTFTLKPLKIPRKFHADFIRGFFDGDGCFAYHKTLNTYKSMITNASKSMLEWIHKNSPTQKGVVYKRKNTNCHELRYGFWDTLRFGNFMYGDLNENTIYLKRKYDIFNKIRQHQTKSTMEG